MQKLQCEACGSIDIIKTEENVFQCQHCGCKYTLEQVKALIFGGEVKTKATDFEIVAGILKKYNGESIDVIIPDNVIRIEDKVFENLPIRSVRFPEGLIAIGDNAFSNCRNLSSISLPESIKNIGKDAFSQTAITEVNIPSTITHVACFRACSALKKVILPGSVTYCDFSGCSFESIELPDSLVSCVFNYCSFTSIVLPKNIKDAWFKGCTSLVSVQLPQGIESVDFSGCTSLSSIQLPQSIIAICFKECTSLTSISLPDGIACIGKEVFANCTSLKSVKLPSGLARIEKDAFSGCVSLQNMVVPDTVKSDWYWDQEENEYRFSHCFVGCDMMTISTPENRRWMRHGPCRYCGCTAFKSTGFLGIVKICAQCNHKKDY